MKPDDFIIISQFETIRSEKFDKFPLDRVELFNNLFQFRMVYFEGGFRSHLDLLNKAFFNKYYHQASYPERRNMFNIWNLPGLNAFLASHHLKKNGFNCKIINNFDSEFDLLCTAARRMSPPIIGISTTFALQWSEIDRITKKIRKETPEAIIVLGGAFVNDRFLVYGTDDLENNIKAVEANYILYGFNSEMDLLMLLKAFKNNDGDFSQVNNLAFLDENNSFRTTKTVWNNPTMDSSPLPWDNCEAIQSSQTVHFRTASGCPFTCSFCSYPTSASGVHYSEMDILKTHLDSIALLKGVESLIFIDDTLNVPPKRFKEIINILKEYSFKWYGFFRAQYADEDMVRQMKESGCEGLYLGMESGSNTILKNMNKSATVDAFHRGLGFLHKYGIKTFGSFIVGFPGEDESTVNETIRFIEQSGIHYYSLKEFYYIHTTAIHSSREKYNLTGQGSMWQHATMSSAQATEIKAHMFNCIKNSQHLDPDLGLWYLIYLKQFGFTWEQIEKSQRVINRMTFKDNSKIYHDKDSDFLELKDIVVAPNIKLNTPDKLSWSFKE